MDALAAGDVKNIRTLLAAGEYQTVYDRYAPVLQDMLFVESAEEWLDYVRQGGGLEEEPLGLYLSARRGERLLLGGYHGDAAPAVLEYLKGRVPEELWEKLKALGRPIEIDIDELDGTLEKQIVPYQEVLEPAGFQFQIDFEDVYCAGAYFLALRAR